MARPLRETLETLLGSGDLSEQESFELLVALTDPEMAPPMAGALLAALRAKGVCADEVRGFARGMRSLARHPRIPPGAPVVDVVGTGGDGSHTFNLSTGTALLAAAAGVRIVKHGNRSVSSRSGSADVLEHLGLKLPLDETAAGACLEATGFTFLFAPHYHPAMKAIAPVRAALGIRTVFNLLGPLTNPAEAPYAVIGAWSLDIAALMADTLAGMPVERMFVVHGETGWDEPTPAAPFVLFDVRPGSVTRHRREAGDFGLPVCRPEELRGADAAHNAAKLAQVLRGQEVGAHRDALVMGAALVLEVTGMAPDPLSAAAAAAAAIDDGRAARVLDALSDFGAGQGG
ncbi:MAG TPA: anthranilate phosphoribosyltransferase [Steroidobacteraceae bacterium]|nr:anthranilate phosphoribosyltransferase [Steroidobacteraceae bacterium]